MNKNDKGIAKVYNVGEIKVPVKYIMEYENLLKLDDTYMSLHDNTLYYVIMEKLNFPYKLKYNLYMVEDSILDIKEVHAKTAIQPKIQNWFQSSKNTSNSEQLFSTQQIAEAQILRLVKIRVRLHKILLQIKMTLITSKMTTFVRLKQ